MNHSTSTLLVLYTMVSMAAVFGAYISSIFVTLFDNNLTQDDWTIIEDHISSQHYFMLMMTVVLTYATNALVFLRYYVEKLICGDDSFCKILYAVVTFIAISVAGVLGAITAAKLTELTEDSNELPLDFVTKVTYLRYAITALAVCELSGAIITLFIFCYFMMCTV